MLLVGGRVGIEGHWVELEQLKVEIGSPIVRLLFDHWLAARGGRQIPVWRDIDATRIVKALPLISVWQVGADGEVRGRLCGAETRFFLGNSIKGKTVDEVFPPYIATGVRILILDATQNRTIIHLRGQMPNRRGDLVEYERITLPLSFDGSVCDGAIAVRVGAGIVPAEQYDEDTPWEPMPENRVAV
jgi:hypothetical protein